MEGSLIIGVVLIALVVTYHFWSLPKTLLLIAKVQPYEQAGTGEGSILVIGDSTGYGTGARSTGESFAGMVGNSYPNYSITNDSVNGRKIEGAMTALAEIDDSHDLIIFQIAANDLLAERPVENVVGDMKMLVREALFHGDQVLVLTSGNIGAAPRFTGEKAESYRAASESYTEAMVDLATGWKDVSFVPLYEDPATDVFVKDPRNYMANDGLHPTTEGYKVWFQKATPFLAEILIRG